MKIKQLRKWAGMTQGQLAEWLGVTRVHVAHLEGGQRPPGPQTVRLLEILTERVESVQIKLVQRKGKGSQQ